MRRTAVRTEGAVTRAGMNTTGGKSTVQFRMADVDNWTFGEPSAEQSAPDICALMDAFWRFFTAARLAYAAKHVAIFSTGFNALVRQNFVLPARSPISHLLLPGRVDAVSNNGA